MYITLSVIMQLGILRQCSLEREQFNPSIEKDNIGTSTLIPCEVYSSVLELCHDSTEQLNLKH